MIICQECGYENNDGSTICINCMEKLPSETSGTGNDFLSRMEQKEKTELYKTKRFIRIVAVSSVVLIVYFLVFIARAASASDRAEDLVRIRLTETVQNVQSVEIVMCTGSVNGGGYVGGGYEIFGYVYIDDCKVPFTTFVEMDSVWDKGRISRLSYY